MEQHYNNLKDTYQQETNEQQKNYRTVGYVVLLLITAILFCIYQYYKTGQGFLLIIVLLLVISYFLSLKFQDFIKWKKQIFEQLLHINKEEANFIATNNTDAFGDGATYQNAQHSYSYDLDFFGKNSLYQHLNRTATYMGEKELAANLNTILNNDAIIAQQAAVKELSEQIAFRQKINATGNLIADNATIYNEIILWTKKRQAPLAKSIVVWSYVLPTITIALVILYAITDSTRIFNLASASFIGNLFFIGTQFKKIKQELLTTDKIDRIIKGYALLVKEIEIADFKTTKLVDLQNNIKQDGITASVKIKELSKLFSNLNSVENVVGATIFNGFFLGHVHVLRQLLQWKEKHATLLQNCLQTIGTIEALSSIANFSFNNPTYVFPTLHTKYKINFEQLGHPLIKSSKRVCNSVSFEQQNFMILSGSNMSGKSTFLRTLGINMVLGGIGAPVCATKASMHPLQVLTSMRLVDNLHAEESYFFAEVKRLKFISDTLTQQPCFVLLDEILRGTNSDDKQNGTIEIIKKLIEKKAIGVIATHDLEVCNTSLEYPQTLFNKCFEVLIQNNELHFDYQLRDGVCKNKSASFLMKKMGVIG
jgi:hypothetical protein